MVNVAFSGGRNYHEFVKDRGIIFYLPPWSSAEIIQYIDKMCSCEAGEKFIQQLMTSPAFRDATVAYLEQQDGPLFKAIVRASHP